MDNKAWSGHVSLREKAWGRCCRALLFASSHETTLPSSSFSSFSEIQFQLPLKFFSCEELQEKACAWKWLFHYLWIEAAGECFEKGHPKVKMKEVVRPRVSSPAVEPYVFPTIKLVHTAMSSLCDCFHLCNCVGVTALKSAAVLNLSLTYSSHLQFSTQWVHWRQKSLCESRYLNICPKIAISESSWGKGTDNSSPLLTRDGGFPYNAPAHSLKHRFASDMVSI